MRELGGFINQDVKEMLGVISGAFRADIGSLVSNIQETQQVLGVK